MESSKLYTFQKQTSSKRKFVGSTIALSALALVGGLGVTWQLDSTAITTLFGGTQSSSQTTTSGKTSGSATGDAVDYQYGTVQLKVTEASGKITAVDLVQAGATNGREAAFSMLVSAAIQANGTSFGNLSGATFTTDAFKQALKSAITKLG